MDGIRSFRELPAEQQAYAGGKGRVTRFVVARSGGFPNGRALSCCVMTKRQEVRS
jgi:hypothetical protein